MSKIKVIIPNAGMSLSKLRYRERMLKAVAREDTEINVDCIKAGPASIESRYDSVMASRYILEEVKAAEKSGFDAIIIYCGDDPALDAAREIVNIPVIGPGVVSIYIASMLCRKFTIIGGEEGFIKSKLNYSCLASTRSLNIPVLDLRDSKGVVKEVKELLIRESRKAIEEDGAEAIVLGCLGLAGIGKEVQKKLGVPVIDPAFVSINMAELLIHSNLTHSKLTYRNPPKKKYYTQKE